MTGEAVPPTLELVWVSDPQKGMSAEFGIAEEKSYRMLLPSNTGITLRVSGPKHKSFTYPGTINVGPGEELTLDVVLDRDVPAPK
jgi:hypothetical protein